MLKVVYKPRHQDAIALLPKIPAFRAEDQTQIASVSLMRSYIALSVRHWGAVKIILTGSFKRPGFFAICIYRDRCLPDLRLLASDLFISRS